METYTQKILQEKIRDLLHTSIQAYNVKENDAVNLKTLKLLLVGHVLETLGIDWSYLHYLHKNHTPVHPEMAKILMEVGDEDIVNTLAQGFVKNEKLIRMLKTLTSHGLNMDKLLAVDGLGGNLSNGPNFEQKYYVGNLKYGHMLDRKTIFDNDPEYKRLHVQTVRELYNALKDVPVPEKQMYEIVRKCIEEMANVKLPEVEFTEEEMMDKKIQAECGRLYMESMGKENIISLAKSLKRFRGEKRANTERESESECVVDK